MWPNVIVAPDALYGALAHPGFAISRLDLLWREGSYFKAANFPARIGYDAAGVVESVDPQAKALEVGDRVSTLPAASHLTEGVGAEVIYDTVAGPGLEELVWATKRSGRVIVYGHLGAMEFGTSLPLGACFLRSIKVHAGFRVFDFIEHPRLGLKAKTDSVERAKRLIYDGLAANIFWAKIDRVFCGLREYAAAHRYMSSSLFPAGDFCGPGSHHDLAIVTAAPSDTPGRGSVIT